MEETCKWVGFTQLDSRHTSSTHTSFENQEKNDRHVCSEQMLCSKAREVLGISTPQSNRQLGWHWWGFEKAISYHQWSVLWQTVHFVLYLQEYASTALLEWEKIESSNGKLGRGKKLLWTRLKSESASLLTLRAFRNFLGPDCDAQSGMVEEFKTIVPISHLIAYHGHWFHIPFHNSAAVISAWSTIWYTSKSYVHPLIQTGGKYVHQMSKRGSDPLPLLNDSCLLFKEFTPKWNEWHRALYQPTSEIVEHLKKQALSIVLHNMFVCVSRQLEDILPGGRFHNADAQLRADTSTFPKDNLSAECQHSVVWMHTSLVTQQDSALSWHYGAWREKYSSRLPGGNDQGISNYTRVKV